MTYLLRDVSEDYDTWLACFATWNTFLTLWIASLVHLRSRQNPRRDWAWIWPVAFFVIALAWCASPMLWDLEPGLSASHWWPCGSSTGKSAVPVRNGAGSITYVCWRCRFALACCGGNSPRPLRWKEAKTH